AIQKLHLERNPEFVDPHTLLPYDTETLLRQVNNHLTIARPPGSMLLNVDFRSHDPQLAAAMANAIAQSYLDLEYSSRANALRESSKYMAGQLDQLRAQMETSQKKLVDYESHTDVVDPGNKDNIMTARLSQINEDLTKAQNQRTLLEAEVRT